MRKIFYKFKIIFYSINLLVFFLYLFPGSILGWIIYNDKKIQPQITPDFIISSNHFYVFVIISIIGFLSFKEIKQIKILIVYLILVSIILETFHLIIPERSFQWSDLFGNFFGVIIVIFINNLINKYEIFKN
tara:strand:- start:370 stop:765 length:396 start_codon:yes stop_codon:yes gene_type:complete